MGFALRNIPVINVAEHIDPLWSSALRLAYITELSITLDELVNTVIMSELLSTA